MTEDNVGRRILTITVADRLGVNADEIDLDGFVGEYIATFGYKDPGEVDDKVFWGLVQQFDLRHG